LKYLTAISLLILSRRALWETGDRRGRDAAVMTRQKKGWAADDRQRTEYPTDSTHGPHTAQPDRATLCLIDNGDYRWLRPPTDRPPPTDRQTAAAQKSVRSPHGRFIPYKSSLAVGRSVDANMRRLQVRRRTEPHFLRQSINMDWAPRDVDLRPEDLCRYSAVRPSVRLSRRSHSTTRPVPHEPTIRSTKTTNTFRLYLFMYSRTVIAHCSAPNFTPILLSFPLRSMLAWPS